MLWLSIPLTIKHQAAAEVKYSPIITISLSGVYCMSPDNNSDSTDPRFRKSGGQLGEGQHLSAINKTVTTVTWVIKHPL